MLIGINKDEVFEYISETEKGAASPTVFLIGVMTNAQKMSLIGNVIGNDGQVNPVAFKDKVLDICKLGLKGIRNFGDPVTKMSKDIKEITDDVLDAIPFEVMFEVSGSIIKYNFISESERKNL